MLRLFQNITFPGAVDSAKQRQPAGFDLSLKSIDSFSGSGVIDFSNQKRELPDLNHLEWQVDADGSHHVHLVAGGYLVTYNEEIAVPGDSAGIVLPRSSLMRCGATLYSALWDPGYRGRGQGLLSVFTPEGIKLYKDARIGQFILIALESEAEELYSGKYQGENL